MNILILNKKISKLLSFENKNRVFAIGVILIMMISTMFAIAPTSAYYTPALHRPTGTYVGISPTLVGLGQTVLVNIITYPAPRTPSFWVGNLVGVYPSGFMNISVTMTTPDGTKNTFMPIDETLSALGVNVPGAAEIVGSLQYEFTPDQIGNYTFTASFPGQIYTNDGVTTTLNQTVYYDASSSASTTLTVQKDPVLAGVLNGYPWSPLPNAYWSNPVLTNNREWATISGAWVESGYDNMATKYNPYSTAPTTPHIVWANVVGEGGLVGGQWSSLGYMPPIAGGGTIILDGKIYQPSALSVGSLDCIDLRTGQLLWTKNGTFGAVPTIANQMNVPFQTSAQVQEGGVTGMLLQLQTANGQWIAYNPYNLSPLSTAGNSAIIQTIINVPSDITAPAFLNGNPITYVVQRGGFNTTVPMDFAYENLICWNLTKLMSYAVGTQTPTTTNNWLKGVQWNVSIRQPDGTDPGFSAVSGNAAVSVNWFPNAGVAAVHGATGYMGFDMATGKFLWNMSTVETMNGGGTGGPTGPETYGPQLIFDGSSNSWVAYDITTGKQMWKTVVGQGPWADLPSFLNVFHNGNVYLGSYDGHVYALSLKDGHIIWTSDFVGKEDESIYGNQVFNGAAAGADGILYYSTSTTYNLQPRTRFHNIYAINETTGHFLWTLPIDLKPTAIAYGYLIGTDTENGIQYAIGKGQTTTTVSATPAIGNAATIQGSVMDMSPGNPNTAAVSDSDMSVWMDYLYGQNATLINSPPTPHGVTVLLSAVDPNGNNVDLGTTTCDSSGQFAKSFVPSTPGLYTIFATFAGSNSYYSSYAETHIAVAASSTSSPTTTAKSSSEIANTDMITYLVIGVIAIIIAITIATILILRKK